MSSDPHPPTPQGTSVAHPYYERYWSDDGFNPRRDGPSAHLHHIFERFVLPEDDCLDVGCGDGGSSGIYLAQHARSYTGVDVSEGAVALARQRGLDAKRIDDAGSLPFPDAAFDLVVCVEVLEHLFAPDQAASEARRVLRPGGRYVVTVPNAAYWRDRVDALFGVWQPGGDSLGRLEPWRSPHIRFFRPKTLQRMLMAAGFEELVLFGIPAPLAGRIPGLRRYANGVGPGARLGARLAPSLLAGGVAAVAILP